MEMPLIIRSAEELARHPVARRRFAEFLVVLRQVRMEREEASGREHGTVDAELGTGRAAPVEDVTR